MNKRLGDQILVLDAIKSVRSELKWGMPMKDATEVTMRLVTLYSLLNVEQLKRCAELIDDRKQDDSSERKAA